MGEADFSYHGDLTAMPLPRLLATVGRYQVPGETEIERDGERRLLSFADGCVVGAASTDRSESLGEFLLRSGRVSRAQYEVSTGELARSAPGLRHGAVLVQMGFLSSEDLAAAVREQNRQILWNLFNWERGRVVCRVGRTSSGARTLNLPIPRVILSGCKRISDVRVATARLGGRQTVLQRQEWPEHLGGFRLESGERSLLDLVDGKRTLFELCQGGPMSPGINARVLYAFSELGLIGRDTGHIKIQVRSAPG